MRKHNKKREMKSLTLTLTLTERKRHKGIPSVRKESDSKKKTKK
jgi:hypothetical protein